MKKPTRKEKIQIQAEKRNYRNEVEQYKSKLIYGKTFVAIGIVFLLFFGNSWMNRNNTIEESELANIEGTISHQLKKERRKSAGNFINIHLNEYPNTTFKIGRFSAHSINIEEVNNLIDAHEIFQIQFEKKDKVKLDKRGKTVWIYGLSSNNRTYLKVADFNRDMKKDRNSISMYLIIGFSIWMFVYGLYMIGSNTKPTDSKQ